MFDDTNGTGDGGLAVADLSGVSDESRGLREIKTLRNVIVEAPHLGTMADSKLPVSYATKVQVDSHDSDSCFRGHVIRDPSGNVFLQREGIEGSKYRRNECGPKSELRSVCLVKSSRSNQNP